MGELQIYDKYQRVCTLDEIVFSTMQLLLFCGLLRLGKIGADRYFKIR